MIRGIFYFLFLVICGASSLAQQITFNRAYEYDSTLDYGKSLVKTLDNKYLFVGDSWDTWGMGIEGIWVLKIDTNGDTLWSRFFDLSAGDFVHAALQTKDSSYIIMGSAEVDTGNFDIFLLKLNSNGDSVWLQKYGGTENNYGDDVKQTADGGLIILANTKDYFTDTILDFNAWLIKTDSNGNVEWDSVYGGTGSDITEKLIITNDGGFVFAGEKGSDGWLVKTGSNGNLLWEKVFDDAERLDFEGGVIQSLDNGFLLTGDHDSSGVTYAYVLKTDEFGNKQWDNLYGNANSFFWAAAVQLQDSSYAVAGSNFVTPDNLEGWLLKIAPDGTELWSRYYTKYGYHVPSSQYNQEYFYDIKATDDGGFILGGYTTNIGEFTGQDFWLVKVDSNGCLIPNCNVGIEELEHEEVGVNIYPNPATNQIFIESNYTNAEVVFYDLTGRTMKRLKLEGSKMALNTTQWTSGVYFFELRSGNGIERGKLMIAK